MRRNIRAPRCASGSDARGTRAESHLPLALRRAAHGSKALSPDQYQFATYLKRRKRRGVRSSWGTLILFVDSSETKPAKLVRKVGSTMRNISRGLSARGNFGVDHTASSLAVDASTCGPHHARLVSGRGPRSIGRDWLPVDFQRMDSEMRLTLLFPFPSFLARRAHPEGM